MTLFNADQAETLSKFIVGIIFYIVGYRAGKRDGVDQERERVMAILERWRESKTLVLDEYTAMRDRLRRRGN